VAAAAGVGEEPTSTERAIAAVRDHLTQMQQALGAGSAEAAGRTLKQKRKRHRQSLKKGLPPPSVDPNAAEVGTEEVTVPAAPAVAAKTVGPQNPTNGGKVSGSPGGKKIKTKKQKRDLVTRYIVLLVCLVAIILCLLGMSFLSWKSHGRWWGPTPEHRPLLG
jgi:hypothetical protein